MIRTCKICLEQHDEEIHEATDRVHGWFRAQVTKHLREATDEPVVSGSENLGAPQLHAA